MALRINTNVAALNAHKNMIKTDNKLSGSLERLSSGLRINKAADDASGMSIADSLRSQSMGLGQAIKNANDGINIVQTADAALDESINIINTIKTKSIQAAQDGQTTDSRKAIQSDVSKLMEELDMIANTTSFNNQKLLSGNFTDKKFQIGAYSGETVNLSIGASQSSKIGHVMSSKLELAGDKAGTVDISLYSNLQDKNFDVGVVDVAYDNTKEHSLGAVAEAINKLSDILGISAKANVSSTTEGNVAEGKTDKDFAINKVVIGEIDVKSGDTSGTLVKAINNKTSEHGVQASVDADGKMTLTSNDGRAIEVSTGSGGGTEQVLGTADMSTIGYVQLNQTGSNEIIVNNTACGDVVALSNDLDVHSADITDRDSNIAQGSLLKANSTLGAGWSTEQNLYGDDFTSDITTSKESLLTKGSVIGSGSIVATNGTIGADMTLSAASTATTGTGSIITGSTVALGSTLGAGTTIAASTDLTGESTTIQATGAATVGDSTLADGSILGAGTTLGADTTLSGMSNVAIAKTGETKGTSTLVTGSTLAAGSVIANGSTLSGGTAIVNQTGDTVGNSTIADGSTLAKGTVLGAGTTVAGHTGSGVAVGTSGITINQTDKTTGASTVVSGSILKAGTVISAGTTVDGLASVISGVTSGDVLTEDYTLLVDGTLSGSMTLKADSILANESMLIEGSSVMADITASQDMILSGAGLTAKVNSSFAAETQLVSGSEVTTDLTLKTAMTLVAGMEIKAGSVLGESSNLQTDSQIAADITLVAATTLSGSDAVVKTGTSFGDNTTLEGGSNVATDITLSAASTLSGAMTLTGDLAVGENTQLATGSILKEGSSLTTSFALSGNSTLNNDMTLAANSSLENSNATLFKAGSEIGGSATLDSDLSVLGDMTIGAGSKLQRGTTLSNGSTLGGTVALANDEKVAAGTQMELAAGSKLADGSTIAAGTYLTNDITTTDGTVKAGSMLREDITTMGDNTLRNQMTLEEGSVLKARSELATNNADANEATAQVKDAKGSRLSDLSVLTQEGAQTAIAIADAALKDLDKNRADLGSIQNQLTSTISNISTTKVNVQSAESSIRDVDFAEESSTFTKMQILQQAGTFAMSQANSSAQGVMSLLQ
jgi:flagellin